MIVVNGEPMRRNAGETIAALLARLGVQSTRGVAVAVDGEVVPRGRWSEHALAEGMRVEILTAMQGG